MEIERKYLVNLIPFPLDKFECWVIRQAYVSRAPLIRIRQLNDDFYLTVKGNGDLVKEEFEMKLTSDEYNNLRKKVEYNEIAKKRYLIPIDGYTAEFDVYENELLGLYTVEVEFASVEEANSFVPPEWFGLEVTYDNRYGNVALAAEGTPRDFMRGTE